VTDAKDLISMLKLRKKMLLSAAEWNVVFKAYQEDEDLREDARDIILQYAETMITHNIINKDIDGIFADDYRLKALDRVEKDVLSNPNWVVVSHLRNIIKNWSLPDIIKDSSVKVINESISTTKNEDGETIYIVYTLPDDKPKIESEFICREQQEYVLKCVDEMNDKDQFVVKSLFFKGMIQAEVGKLLNVGRAAIAERLRSIKKRLRSKLAEIDAEKTVSYATSEGV
jgi:RNA polymerase sigma factor (sigma-70 family)